MCCACLFMLVLCEQCLKEVIQRMETENFWQENVSFFFCGEMLWENVSWSLVWYDFNSFLGNGVEAIKELFDHFEMWSPQQLRSI